VVWPSGLDEDEESFYYDKLLHRNFWWKKKLKTILGFTPFKVEI